MRGNSLRERGRVAIARAMVSRPRLLLFEQQRVTIRPIHERRTNDVEFMMLKDGRIHFKGALGDLRASKDPYVRAFLS